MCRIRLNTILCKYAGIAVPIGETENRAAYLETKQRASKGPEDQKYAAFILKKVETLADFEKNA
jgi:hypothetical protein